MATYTTGDTIRPEFTFRNWAEPPTLGSLVNPDNIAVTVYDADQQPITANVTVPALESVGVYVCDWVLPVEPGSYTLEVNGMINAKPVIKRLRVKIKFRPV